MGSPSEVTLSSPPPNEKSSETLRKSSATSPSTSSKKWTPPLLPPLWKNPTNSQTVRSSPSVTNDSDAQRPSSSHPSLVWNPPVSTKPPTTPLSSAISISERTSTPTTSCPVVPPCTQVLPIECRKKSLIWLHPPSTENASNLLILVSYIVCFGSQHQRVYGFFVKHQLFSRKISS